MRNKVKDIVVSAVSLMVIAGVTTAAPCRDECPDCRHHRRAQ